MFFGNVFSSIGRYTTNFTSTNHLFWNNPNENLWRFEVIYTFDNQTSLSALNFRINPAPSNGSCSIDQINGTIQTLFNITCLDWYNPDDIRDYSLYCLLNKTLMIE